MKPVEMPTPSSRSFSDVDGDFTKMELAYFSNEFPKDDLQGLMRQLHTHSKDRRYPILAQFLDEATLAIREEVRQLPGPLRALIPPFETILTFSDFTALRTGPLCGSIDGILLCTVELGTFIGYHEANPGRHDFNTGNMSLAGLGIGLLATAAVSLAHTLSDLPLAGAQVIRQAFRLGVLVDDVSQNLQPRELHSSSHDTWAYVLPEVAAERVQEELDRIHAEEKTPALSKIFISAPSATSVTISGPPARLKALFRTADFFRDGKHIALPVYGGLCHAAHVYNLEHVHHIVRTPSMALLDTRMSPRLPVLSTSTGEPFPAESATELFESIINEILTKAIQWDSVVRGVVRRASKGDVSHCEVLVFRVSLPVHDLAASLEKLSGIETHTEELIPWLNEEPKTTAEGEGQPRGPMQSKIAIVGMSCRMPGGATDTEKFWQLLESGLDVHRRIPADRFDVDTHWDPAGKRMNTSHTQYGCFIDEPGLFDAPFFNISPREAQQTDPMQRLALVTAYEALERSGYVANRTASTDLHRIGTFYGQASDDYREVNTAQEISTYFIPGGCRAFGPGRINYFFKFSGPSYSIDTACSSSLATIQTACTSLWAGDVDMAVAGGMNVLTNSDAFAGLSHGHFLTKTPNACKTWDSEADGYCRADAVASIVLKRLEDAEADNDNILGVILAAGTNHSAEAISITHPHAGHQAYLSTLVSNRAAIDPLSVGFIEMHGTGTQAGDAEEIQSVTNVFAPLTRRRSAKNPLYIGAVKANVGHSEAAAGVTAVVKVLLMLEKNAIPPHVGIKNSLNPKFPKDMDKRNIHIPYEKVDWPRVPGKKRLAMVNNFSAAGGNSTVAIEEAPERQRAGTDDRPTQVVAVSAKSKVSLKGNLERMLAYLESNPETLLADLAYSTTARRYHHNHRVAVTGSSIDQVKKKLKSALAGADTATPIPTTGPPSVAFAFTGQGASFKSFNLELFHSSPFFRSQILHLDGLARGQGFPSFVPVLDGSVPDKNHSHPPVITQLALCCLEIALARYWGSLGVKPDVVLGHSLGEYAALHVAGVLSAADAIFLVGQRARMLEHKCRIGSHKMLAVGASVAQVETSAGGKLPYEIACVNSTKETVLSGPVADLDALKPVLEGDGYKCYSLDVAFAFHSAQTDPILDEYEAMARTSGIVFHEPLMPIISPLLGRVIFDDKTVNANYMRRTTREPVNLVPALARAVEIGTVDKDTAWVEIGPHPVCTGFVKTNIPSVSLATASFRRGDNNWTTMAQALAALHCAGVAVDWNEFHRPFERAVRLLPDLPTYKWNDKTYWIQYNGDWALTKGNTFYDAEKAALTAAQQGPAALPSKSSLSTSTVQRIVEEEFSGTAGSVTMQSDLSQPDFRSAAWGHKMNECGVVTSSIHADISYTLGAYLYKKLKPKSKEIPCINIANLDVHKGLIANKSPDSPQRIQVSATTADIDSRVAHLVWHNVDASTGATVDEPFAHATLVFGIAADWLASWVPAKHLVEGRIADLERLAEAGKANRFTRDMAYLLFATRLVDYADKYRGMHSVVLHGLEAFADVTLSAEKGGSWTVPPYFIDSVAHLAGFVMNVSDVMDSKANFCVTPGWSSMRFARPLVGGAKYRSYVKMIPSTDDPTVFFGDVYVLQEGTIIGMVGGIQFRSYPRILLSRFFSAPDDAKAPPVASAPLAASSGRSGKHHDGGGGAGAAVLLHAAGEPPGTILQSDAKPPRAQSAALRLPAPAAPPTLAEEAVASTPASALVHGKGAAAASVPKPSANPDSTSAKAILLIAAEAAVDLEDLVDEASFANLGVDSLMSLVIAEKFREQLGVVVSGSLFLEYPTVGDLRSWLEEYYN